MPGGKITIKSDIPDLESFLARKRCPLDKWLLARNITSLEAFKALINTDQWVISENLIKSVEELLKPIPVPVKAIVPIVVVSEVLEIEEPKQIIMVSEEETNQESEIQTILNNENSVVSPIEEVVTHIVEETSLVPVNSYKERKKTR